jgi:hypothetical protein
MMTTTQARRVSALLAANDQIEEWLDTFNQPEVGTEHYIQFSDIAHSDAPSFETSHGWVGELVLPRDVVIRMLAHELEAIAAELVSVGVIDSTPAGQAPTAL